MATPELKSSKSPLPAVKEFDAATCTIAELVDALRHTGGIIVRNLLSAEEIAQIEVDVRPWLEDDKPWDGEMFPQETRRAFSMLGKSKTFALRIVGHPLWLGVTDALLTSTLKSNWVGDKNEVSVSGPQLNNTIVFSIRPGAHNQPLHRDDAIHHIDLPAVAEHEIGRDAGIGFFVAGKPSTKENGATRFIPGSHLWDYSEGPAREEQAVYAELGPGDGFMMLSGCFHGGSANTTADEERLLFSTFSTRGWMRQEENQYLAVDIQKIKELPEWLQERVGYGLSRPFLGWVDLKNPMLILHPVRQEELL
ncbi:phytanoyl-CoA dioxygenase family protein [Xylariales sp. PMI_506]|nr:phytanoyl-CoA dioxygenase family protein [Xylariales sp. PMI_506]